MALPTAGSSSTIEISGTEEMRLPFFAVSDSSTSIPQDRFNVGFRTEAGLPGFSSTVVSQRRLTGPAVLLIKFVKIKRDVARLLLDGGAEAADGSPNGLNDPASTTVGDGEQKRLRRVVHKMLRAKFCRNRSRPRRLFRSAGGRGWLAPTKKRLQSAAKLLWSRGCELLNPAHRPNYC